MKATAKLKLCKTGNIAVLDFYISIQSQQKVWKVKDFYLLFAVVNVLSWNKSSVELCLLYTPQAASQTEPDRFFIYVLSVQNSF